MADPMPPDNLHARIAKALGWTEAGVRSFTLAALRELVRPVSRKLAHEITLALKEVTEVAQQDALTLQVVEDLDRAANGLYVLGDFERADEVDNVRTRIFKTKRARIMAAITARDAAVRRG